MCALKALFTGVIETPVGRGALSDAVAESLRAIENLPGVACPSWPLLARLGRVDRGAARPFIGVKRSRTLLARNDAIDPGCVKTPQARERLELFFPDRPNPSRITIFAAKFAIEKMIHSIRSPRYSVFTRSRPLPDAEFAISGSPPSLHPQCRLPLGSSCAAVARAGFPLPRPQNSWPPRRTATDPRRRTCLC